MSKGRGEHKVQFKRKPDAPLTLKEREELEALAAMPDEQIDTSDAPEISMEIWERAGMVGRFYRPVKKAVTIRLDADVIHWLKADGKGYQTKANRLLRQHMLAEYRNRQGSDEQSPKPRAIRVAKKHQRKLPGVVTPLH